jgi:hypothetical protein
VRTLQQVQLPHEASHIATRGQPLLLALPIAILQAQPVAPPQVLLQRGCVDTFCLWACRDSA